MVVSSDAVVPKPRHLTEGEFHTALIGDLSRLAGLWGKEGLALRLGMTSRQLGNVMAGSTPQPQRLFNLFADEPTSLANLLEKYGLRTVPRDAVCTSDPGTLPLAVLLQHVAKAEHPESHGGHEITRYEAGHIPERDLLAAQRVLDQIFALRAGLKPGVRAVAA